MKSGAKKAFTFEGYTLDLTRGCLRAGENEIKLRPKCLELLRYLVENPGRLVLKDELAEAIWPNVIVSDDSLAQCISDLRDALNDVDRRIIKTVTRRGYWFAAPVSISAPDEAIALPALAPTRLSIVVLPFANLSGDPGQEYLVDGITDDLTTDLSRISGSFVISRSTAFTYKRKAVDTRQLGRELGVRYVLEGSVRRTEDRIRLNAQLIDSQSGAHLWADRFGTDRVQLREAQDAITGRLAQRLKLELLENVGRGIERESGADLGVNDLVVYGQALLNRPYSAVTLLRAQRVFEQALERDPEAVEPKIGIATALLTKIANAWSVSASGDEVRAECLLLDALARNTNDASARSAMGLLRRLRDELEDSQIELETAIALDPDNVTAVRQLGYTLMHSGHPEEAIPIIEKGIRLSPYDAGISGAYQVLGICHLIIGQVEQAIGFFRMARAGNPRLYHTYTSLAAALALKGNLEKAKFALQTAIKLRPDLHSIARLRASLPYNDLRYIALLEKTAFVGLRQAGLPDR